MAEPISTTFLRDVQHGGTADQPGRVAQEFATFVGAAEHSLDLSIYDFRLDGPELAHTVVAALTGAADRGVAVRIGFDAGKPAGATAETFALLEADPAPTGTADWVRGQFGGTAVQVKPIKAGSQLMHDKFAVRDGAGEGSPAVWTGSTNFTDAAWTRQENNIVRVASAAVAAAYLADFEQLWAAGAIFHTGTGLGGAAAGTSWDFSPGDGPDIDAAMVDLVDKAQTRVIVASMVLTSHPLLAALASTLDRKLPVSGIYDSGQMGPIVKAWEASGHQQQVLTDFRYVAGHLAAKRSAPYTPTGPHNFMHNKVLVVDDTVVTGSFNLSGNAQRNAENQLRITDPTLADSYAGYIAAVVGAYS